MASHRDPFICNIHKTVEINISGGLTIGEVDCTVSKNVCSEQGVAGYPTILLFKDGAKVEKYSSSRTIER